MSEKIIYIHIKYDDFLILYDSLVDIFTKKFDHKSITQNNIPKKQMLSYFMIPVITYFFKLQRLKDLVNS